MMAVAHGGLGGRTGLTEVSRCALGGRYCGDFGVQWIYLAQLLQRLLVDA